MKNTNAEKISEELRPRLIVWELTREEDRGLNGSLPLDQHECLLALESIARTSKPIVVVTGSSVILRENIREIIDYGHALDLKMIIEIQPEEIDPEIIKRYRNYGARTFRVIIDGRIIEDPETRFRQTSRFLALERTVELLRENGFEIHFSLTINDLNRRTLAYNLDYAFLRSAKGLYCHLNFKNLPGSESPCGIDEFLLHIPEMKEKLPTDMYLSPQCVRYSVKTPGEGGIGESADGRATRWVPTCLAGRTYGFLDACGKLYLCRGTGIAAGDLRNSGYDFKSLWYRSNVLVQRRSDCRSCSEMRFYAGKIKSRKKIMQLVVQEKIGNLP